MNLLKIAVVIVLTVSAALANTNSPGGRLSLQSNTPVMTTDVVNTSTVYYVPYNDAVVPFWGGGSFWNSSVLSGQLTLTLDSTHNIAGKIYDVFLYSAPAMTLCTGPAWSGVNPLTSRGTGTGTTEITQFTGLWSNANSIAQCYNNGVGFNLNLPSYHALYVGSIYMTANGATSMQFKPSAASGGTSNGNFIGIWNAYNRVRAATINRDSNTGWTNGTPGWREMDGNANNRVTYLDGLAQTSVTATLFTNAYNNVATGGCQIGVLQNATSGFPNLIGSFQGSSGGNAAGAPSISSTENFLPALGLNYIQAMEDAANASTTCTFAFNGNETGLLVDTEY